MKKFIEKHGTKLIAGGLAITCTAGAVLAYKAYKIPVGAIHALGNPEYGTIDILLGEGKDALHLWVIDMEDARILAEEFEEAMNVASKSLYV